MVGDNINIKKEYYATAQAIIGHVQSRGLLGGTPRVLCIGGESGSGKSVTGICLQTELKNSHGIRSLVLHQDDYFKLPPQTNHLSRLKDISKVGKGEVDLALMQKHIHEFKTGAGSLSKPLVNYGLNEIHHEVVDTKDVAILIIEGTYCLSLSDADFMVFMDRTFHETYAQRVARGREQADPFIEDVLEIEHRIIRPMRSSADVIVTKDYQVELQIHDNK